MKGKFHPSIISDKPLVWMVMSLSALFVLRDCFSININQYIILGLYSLFLICSNFERCVYLTIIAMPLLCGMQGFIATVALIILYIKAPQINNWQWGPLIVIAVLELLNWGDVSNSTSIKEYVLLCSFVGIFFFFLNDNLENISRKKVISYYLLSTSFVLFLVVFRALSIIGIEGLLSASFRGTNMMEMAGLESDMQTHFALNANSQAYFSIVNISILVLGKDRLGMNTVPFYLVLLISFIAGIVSFSRTWILLMFFLSIVSVLLSKGKKRIALIFTILVLFAGFMASGFSDSVIDSISGRFKEDSIETGGGRTDIFAYYNKMWINDPMKILVGTGSIDYAYKSNYDHSIHNGLQQIYYCYGIVGFLIFILAFMQYFKRSRVLRKSLFSLLPFIICFLFDQSIQFINPHFLMFPFIASLLASEL